MARWAWLVLFAVACGGMGDGGQSRIAPLPLCALCSTGEQCASGVCRRYGDGYSKCSQACGSSQSACPAPSEGFCNLMGYCGCAPYSPPADAIPDGVYIDAAVR